MTEITTEPIFRYVEQALHVSFLMETLPATQKSQMQVILEQMMKTAGFVHDRGNGTINFGGMTPLEIRGQCAMVRAAVMHHLPKPEADAVHAMYAHQKLKAAGVRGVRDYSQPSLSTQGGMATLAMAWGIFCTKRQRKDFSVRKIAEEYGLSHSTVGRDMKVIRNTGHLLFNRGVERIAPLFERQNLVGDI